MSIYIDFETFKMLIQQPYGVLATFLARAFLVKATGNEKIGIYSTCMAGGLPLATVSRAFKALRKLGLVR